MLSNRLQLPADKMQHLVILANSGKPKAALKEAKQFEKLFPQDPALKNFIGIINHGFNWQHWAAKVNYYHSNGIDCLIEHNKEYPNNDTHPNKKGQEMIAEEFWSHYEKNF